MIPILGYANNQTEQLDKYGYLDGVPQHVAKASGAVFDKMRAAVVLQDLLRPPKRNVTKVPGSSPTRLRIHVKDGWWLSFLWKEPYCSDIKIEKA